ncbi:hypothetical protein OJF2_39810 [Aquisphaera giovannonii]|uniref:DUF1800 domain-containing protein n=1 Tax=Aquisphaera giovannonii TaxID=406548 RepID=A0A5B9W5L8_9BACT|nr:DUF1800 domain-containing protein [Aquisphaera giovannonii]QEH35429.1 hypothetical protein OJF2_39810 [Aquisphaera giovannonii]
MTASPWEPYRPDASSPWDLERAWTLRRRAGFGATWGELERDIADGPGPAVDRVLAGECRLDGVPADFGRVAGLIGDAAAGSSDARRLQAWWIYRCLFTPDPLLERLTLAWHDHFATSQLKVEDVAAMRAQNETLRRLARGPFADLVHAMVRDPALLYWLDAPSNKKGKPNENLARELMELFVLGVGNYSEADVKEAARALTGRTVIQGAFRVREADRDDGAKAILDRTGRFDGEALVDHLVAQPAAADRLAWRLCATFLGEGVADATARAELAARLRSDGLHVGRGVATVLRSRLFFSSTNLHARVADPIGFVVGAARALERFDPPPSTLLLAEWLARMGQELFFPPNVGGWPGGRGWLTGRAVVARANFASALVEGHLNPSPAIPDLRGLAARHGRGGGREALGFFAGLLAGRPLEAAELDRVAHGVEGPGSDASRLGRAVALLLAAAECQVC